MDRGDVCGQAPRLGARHRHPGRSAGDRHGNSARDCVPGYVADSGFRCEEDCGISGDARHPGIRRRAARRHGDRLRGSFHPGWSRRPGDHRRLSGDAGPLHPDGGKALWNDFSLSHHRITRSSRVSHDSTDRPKSPVREDGRGVPHPRRYFNWARVRVRANPPSQAWKACVGPTNRHPPSGGTRVGCWRWCFQILSSRLLQPAPDATI